MNPTALPEGIRTFDLKSGARRYEARVPLGRMAKREDMVGMMIFLASDASASCTGQQYFVEGGWTAM